MGETAGQQDGVDDADMRALGNFIDARVIDLAQDGEGALAILEHGEKNVRVLHITAVGVALLDQVIGLGHRHARQREVTDERQQDGAIGAEAGARMEILLAVNRHVDDVVGRESVSARDGHRGDGLVAATGIAGGCIGSQLIGVRGDRTEQKGRQQDSQRLEVQESMTLMDFTWHIFPWVFDRMSSHKHKI